MMNEILLPDHSTLEFFDQGTGHALLFVHAPCIGHVNFHYQAPLADEYRLIIPNLPGHGKSTPAQTTLTITDLAQTIDHLVEKLELDDFSLCGYSQGGSVVLEYLLQHPQKVHSAIIVSGYSEVNTLFMHTRYRAAQALASMGAVGVLARAISSSHLACDELRQKWIQHMEQTDSHTLHHMYQAGHTYNCTARLSEIQTPLLLIYGEEDKPMHSYGKLLHQFLHHSELHFIPYVSHQVVTKAAIPFHQLLTRFVRSHTGHKRKSPVFV